MLPFKIVTYYYFLLLLFVSNKNRLFTVAVCNVCQSNNVACRNMTSYYHCFGANKPNLKQLFHCPDGFVCTDLPNICFQRSERLASCMDTAHCGVCDINRRFACINRRQFAFCFGATVPSNVIGNCTSGTICDAAQTNLCIKYLRANSTVCDLDVK